LICHYNQKRKKITICIICSDWTKRNQTCPFSNWNMKKTRCNGLYNSSLTASASTTSTIVYIARMLVLAGGRVYVRWETCSDYFEIVTKKAVALPWISLLLRVRQGRKPIQEDVFYLHSRMLDKRAAKFKWCIRRAALSRLSRIVETQARRYFCLYSTKRLIFLLQMDKFS